MLNKTLLMDAHELAKLHDEEHHRICLVAEEFAARRALLIEKQTIAVRREALDRDREICRYQISTSSKAPSSAHPRNQCNGSEAVGDQIGDTDPDSDVLLCQEEARRMCLIEKEFAARRALIDEKKTILAEREALEHEREEFLHEQSVAAKSQIKDKLCDSEEEGLKPNAQTTCSTPRDLCSAGTTARTIPLVFQTPPKRSQVDSPLNEDLMTPTSLRFPSEPNFTHIDRTPSPIFANLSKNYSFVPAAPDVSCMSGSTVVGPTDDCYECNPSVRMPPVLPLAEVLKSPPRQRAHFSPAPHFSLPGFRVPAFAPWLPMDADANSTNFRPMHQDFPGQVSGPPLPMPTWTVWAGPGSCFQFNLTLRKADNTEFGLIVSHANPDGPMFVEAVKPEGTVEAWNKQCAGPHAWKAMRPGDQIVSVNGIHNVLGMLNEIHAKKLLRLTITRE